MAFDKTKPTNDGLLINAPAQIRANWEALEALTETALQIINAKVKSDAAIEESKLAFDDGTGHGHIGSGGDGKQITQLGTLTANVDFAKYQALQIVIHNATSASPPSNPGQGQLWFDSTNKKLKYWNNTAWIESAEGGDANTVDGIHAAATPVVNKLLALDASSQFPTSVIKNASVGQAQLKTAIGSVSVVISPRQGSVETAILPGGEYGFMFNIKKTGEGTGKLHGLTYTTIPTSYTTPKACFENTYLNGTYYNITAYAQVRYITASGKDHWIFLLVDKQTKKIISGYEAPDHPCANQGGATEIDIPHPFGSYDSEKHEIVLVDNNIISQLKPLISRKNCLLTLINEKCIINDTKRPKYKPREIIKIDEYGDIEGEVIKRMKTPEWAKIMLPDEITLKKRVVEKLPDYILYKNLTKK